MGGVISLVEVSHTPFAKFFFSNFHPEPFDDLSLEWKALDVEGAEWKANQSLSWNIFVRDRSIFNKQYPSFEIEKIEYLPWLGYLFSGGVTKPCLVANWMAPLFKALQVMLKPLNNILSLHWHIRIRRVK